MIHPSRCDEYILTLVALRVRVTTAGYEASWLSLRQPEDPLNLPVPPPGTYTMVTLRAAIDMAFRSQSPMFELQNSGTARGHVIDRNRPRGARASRQLVTANHHQPPTYVSVLLI